MTGLFNKAAKAMGLSDENAQYDPQTGGQANSMMDSSDRTAAGDRTRFSNNVNRTTADTNNTRFTAGRPKAVNTTSAYGQSSGYADQDYADRDAANITTDAYRTGTYATSSGDYNKNNSSIDRNYGQNNTSSSTGVGNREVGTRGLSSWVNDYDYANTYDNNVHGISGRTASSGDRKSSSGNQYNTPSTTDFYGNRTGYSGGGTSSGNNPMGASTNTGNSGRSDPAAISQSATVGSHAAASSGDYGVNNQNSTVGISGNDAYRQTGTTGTTTTTGNRAGIGTGSSGYGDFGREQNNAGLDTSAYGGRSNMAQATKSGTSAGYDDPYSSYTSTEGGDYKQLGVSGGATGAEHKPRHRGTGGISPTHGFADHPRANDGGYSGGRRRSSGDRRRENSYSSSSSASSSDYPQTGIGSGVHDNAYNTASSRDATYDQSNAVSGPSAGVVGSGATAGGVYGSNTGRTTTAETQGSSGYGAGDRLNNPNSIALDGSGDPTIGTRYDSNPTGTNVGHYNNTGTTAAGGTALGTNVPASGITGGSGATTGYPAAGRSGLDDSSRFNRGNAAAGTTSDQLHSGGGVGGSAANRRPSFGDRVKGAMKQATGTIMRDQEMKLEGEQMRTYGSHATEGAGHTTGRY